MDKKIYTQAIARLQIGMVGLIITAPFFLGLAIWMFSLLGNSNRNPDADLTPLIITAVILIIFSVVSFLLGIILMPKIIKKTKERLKEYEKMHEVYEKHKNEN